MAVESSHAQLYKKIGSILDVLELSTFQRRHTSRVAQLFGSAHAYTQRKSIKNKYAT